MMIDLPTNRLVELDNRNCPYCGEMLVKSLQTVDHVIGRRFVPKGRLAARWNLALKACQRCNGGKAVLENDLSALTMAPDAWGQFAHIAPDLEAEANRKGTAISHITGQPVAQSSSRLVVNSTLMPGVSVSIELVGPPQVEDERVFELARLQLIGFFFFMSYDETQRLGHFWLGQYCPLMASRRSDWGNATQRSFMEKVGIWDPYLIVSTADGFFKVAIRRQEPSGVWSFALEWNHQFRVIGFIGDLGLVESIANELAANPWNVIAGGTETTRSRKETPLAEKDDILFRD